MQFQLPSHHFPTIWLAPAGNWNSRKNVDAMTSAIGRSLRDITRAIKILLTISAKAREEDAKGNKNSKAMCAANADTLTYCRI